MITGVALAALSAAGARAAAAPAAAPDTAVSEVVVTGSRIPQPNLTSISPVTSVSAQAFKLEGTTRVEDLINQLPQVVADQGGAISNGSSGTATVDLRGLGASRTLVLIDGRRLVPGDPFTPFADLNFIPAALIDRVEVDTAGASAVYGSDAVAGVVNFIMKRDFEGVRLDVNDGIYQNNNGNSAAQAANTAKGFTAPTGSTFGGNTVDVTAIFGSNTPDGKGNVEGYVGYRHIDPVLQGSRDYSNCAEALNAKGTGFTCGGSSTNPLGRFIVFDQNFNTTGDYSLDTTKPGNFTNYTGAGAQTYNYAPANYYQRPDERYSGGFFAKYDITPHIEAYSEFMFMDDYSVAQVAPGGVFGNLVTIPCNDPLLSADEVNKICTMSGFGGVGQPGANPNVEVLRRNVEGGDRQTTLRHTDYRAVIGMKGDLDANWHFDAYGQYAASVYSQTNLNYFSNARIPNAFDVVPVGGVATCQSVVTGADPTCVPYNIFTPTGVTPAALNYLGTPGNIAGQTTEQVVSGSINGDLTSYGMKTPWAHEGVGVAIGAEYRRETLEYSPDKAIETGDLAGGVGAQPPLAGAFQVKEVFAETRIPIIQDMPFIKDLSFEGGYRYSDYSSAGGTNTYKLAGDWAISDSIRIRGGFNRAVRAPNVDELFAPQSVGNIGTVDPCAGPVATLKYSAAQCAFSGVTANKYGSILPNPANQYNGLVGGNLNLKPETANTYSLGVVVTPRHFVPGLTLSADYFNIKVTNVITTIPQDTTLTQCIATGSPTLCPLVHRSPGNESLWLLPNGFVDDRTQNLGFLKTSGIDFAADYRTNFHDMGMGDWGGIGLSFIGTYTHNNDTEVLPGVLLQCIGKFGTQCGNPQPRFKSSTRLTYTPPISGLTLSVNWRYFGPVSVDSVPNTPAGANCADCRVEAYNWFDLAATWRFRDKYTFRAGVNNVFDRDPPILGSAQIPVGFGNGNTYPQVYDSLGRYMFVGLTADF